VELEPKPEPHRVAAPTKWCCSWRLRHRLRNMHWLPAVTYPPVCSLSTRGLFLGLVMRIKKKNWKIFARTQMQYDNVFSLEDKIKEICWFLLIQQIFTTAQLKYLTAEKRKNFSFNQQKKIIVKIKIFYIAQCLQEQTPWKYNWSDVFVDQSQNTWLGIRFEGG
jgi:hypothetical protein